MINRARIRAVVDDTERAYATCLGLLQSLKDGDRRRFSPEDFFKFQPTLCNALIRLDSLYRDIEVIKRTIIERKPNLSLAWFRQRMATLAHYQKVILEVIKVGKFLGDSFAWVFYQNERGYLLQHLSHEGQRHLPPGIGGLGERTFIENTRGILGKLVIYHGTTTILRIGDVSLIDLKTLKLAALGELKTIEVDPDQIQVTIVFIGAVDRLPSAPSPSSSIPQEVNLVGNAAPTLSPAQRDRLRRQIKRMQDTITKEHSRKSAAEISLSSAMYAKQLDQLVNESKRGQFSYVQAGEGLVLGVYRFSAPTLFGRVGALARPGWSSRLGELEAHVVKIIKKGASDNAIYLNGLFFPDHHGPHFIVGSLPLFWWPLSANVLRSIIFQEVIVVSIYNQAHLFARLRACGFEIEAKGQQEYRLEKRIGELTFYVERFSYFIHLIQRNLQSEDFVVEILNKLETDAIRTLRASGVKSARIDLMVLQQIRSEPERNKGNV